MGLSRVNQFLLSPILLLPVPFCHSNRVPDADVPSWRIALVATIDYTKTLPTSASQQSSPKQLQEAVSPISLPANFSKWHPEKA